MDCPSVYSLARATGRGEAGECPACHAHKTPAGPARAHRVAAGSGLISTRVTAHRCGGGVA